MDSEQIKIFLAVFIGGLIVLYIILKILQRIGKFFINVKRLRENNSKSKSENNTTLSNWLDGSVELKTTNLVKKTYKINWVNNMIPYDGAELLKKDFQLNNSVNVPALFKDDGDIYIMIRSNTEASAKKLIDKIINENGGTENFTKGSAAGWAYPHHSDRFTIGYLTQHKVVRLNKHKPQPSEPAKVEISEEGETSELTGSINEIIKLLKSNSKIKIKITADEYWDGYFQLSSDVESESIEHSDIYDPNNGEIITVKTDKKGNQNVKYDKEMVGNINIKKQVYEGRYYIWAEGIIENKSFLKCLNEYINDEEVEADPNENDIYDFIQYCQDYGHIYQDPESINDYFNIKEFKEGSGREIGLDEFSWNFESYVRSADVEIKILS